MPSGRRDFRTNRPALLRYAIFWLAGGMLAALLILAAVRGTSSDPKPRPAPDALRQVVASGCVLQDPRGRSADLSRPPVGGPPSRPVADGIYDDPQPKRRLIGSLRRGVVVIQYDRRLPADQVKRLEEAFIATSPRRVVAPDASGMAFSVAGTAWGRLIGCSKVDDRVVEALRRFAARYAGQGPDASQP
jgi:hypothetical protein